MKKKILVIGGSGFVGTELCNKLINEYHVACLDTFWFGSKLDKKIKKIKHDIRDHDFSCFKNYDIVIHLAYLSNDPLCEINARDTWESGPLALYYIMDACVKYKIKKFMFASSGSIYGLKKERRVTEKLGLDPITDYNKSKMICEKIIESYSNKIPSVILRPATVCGFSKRLRLDLVLNMFCYQAFFKKQITVFGGKQTRPILHIKDMIAAYYFFINNKKIGTFNVGFENLSVLYIAKSVIKEIPSTLKIKKSNDIRSYRMDSSKIIRAGFEQQFNHLDAIRDLKEEFKKNYKPSKKNWNLNWLLSKGIITK